MSASLVGSEMCIRDRPSSTAVRSPKWTPHRRLGCCGGGGEVQWCAKHALVWWFHARAMGWR
eukprot:1805411-Alexandrium_andersonii.AAC.1